MNSEWLTEDVEVPQSLLDALTSDRLVIFAGAGISIPAPTKLLGFADLAKLVAVNAGYPHALKDPTKIDTFLGNVRDYGGANVHRMAEEVLAIHGRRANRVHQALTRLSAAASLRIVTTNFDPYLSRSMKRLGNKSREYIAPALPLGDSFDGLVYLHGKIPLADGDTMVLTDRDFGEAYVTDGWASRFLTRMFSSYNVLFVGYSGTDTVMRYLTRSLPPTGREHFAFVPASELEKWQGLNITTVPFPTEHNYAALPQALEAWVLRVGLTQMDHVARFEEIVAKGLPISAFDESFLSTAFARIETLQHFLAVAEPDEWLSWCETRGDLDILWSKSAGRDSDEAYAWAQWACRSVTGSDPLRLFRAIQRHGGEMSDALWESTWRTLITDYPETGIAGRYISALLDNAQPNRRLDLSLLFAEAVASDRVGALRLLEWAVTPVPRFRRNMWSLTEDHDFAMEFELNGHPHHVGRAWKKLQPLTADEASGFLLNCLGFFVSTSRAARHFNGHESDPISDSRFSIESHWRDQRGNKFGLLIDIARDSLRGLAGRGQPGFATSLIAMAQSESRMIRRLAVDAVAHSAGRDPDTVVLILVDEALLLVPELKREVHRALAAYPSASEAVKDRVLTEIRHGQATTIPGPSAKQRYDLLVRLSGLDPRHQATIDALTKFCEENPEFAPHKSPRPNSFLTNEDRIPGDAMNPRSKPLRELSPQAVMNEISAHEGHHSEEWLGELSSAAADPKWTDALLTTLSEHEIWTEEIWEVLCESICKSPASRDVSQLLQDVASHPSRTKYLDAVTVTLDAEWSSNVTQNVHDVSKQLSGILDLWRSVAGLDDPDLHEEAELYDSARFSPRGKLAYRYLVGMGVLAGLAPEKPILHGDVREALELMLGSERDFETLVVIAGSTGWFLTEDKEWAMANLLPLFDWHHSLETAVPMWTGFLSRGSWSSRTVEKLGESFRSGYPMVSNHLPDSMNAFLDHHSFLYTSGLLPGEDDLWADPLTVAASVEERTEWIDTVSRRYQDSPLSPEAWSRLMKYWSRRSRQTPNALHEQEVHALVQWLLLPGADLREALPVLLVSPIPRGQDAAVRITFDYNKLPLDLYPRESGKVLARVLKGCATGAWVGQDIGLVAQRIGQLGATEEALLVANELVRIGVTGSIESARSIEGGLPESQ